jgi:alpha-beta hydrolase superfamily lysophospholipase
MHQRQRAWVLKSWLMLILATVSVGMVLAQAQPGSRAGRSPIRNQGGVPLKKARPEAADPLAKVGAVAVKPVPGTYHFDFRLRSFDGTPLAASYYPSKLGSSAPVVMFIHETGRSRKDFEEPVLELKGQGLAEHLQGLGYAILSMDLRWQGQNPRRALTTDERPKLMEDLQAGYFFLVDRHNRGDLNLAKLGVIALGDGANLTAAWAFQPGAALTTEGRASDLSALVFVSPQPQGFGYVFQHVLASLAPRVPLLLLAGERDNASKDAVQSVAQLVQRARLNKVELFPSSLHGYKLLRLEPKVTTVLVHFLETTLKNRPIEWEPQYNLTPVTFADIQMVPNAKLQDARKDQAKVQNADALPRAKNQGAKNAEAAPKLPPPDVPPPLPTPEQPN